MPPRIHKTCVDGGIKSDYLFPPKNTPSQTQTKERKVRIVHRPFTSVSCRLVTWPDLYLSRSPVFLVRVQMSIADGTGSLQFLEIPINVQ